jgi:hypothetical protein
MKISLDYFAFSTITRIDLNPTNDFSNPGLTFCALYPNLIDRKDHKKYGIRRVLDWTFIHEEFEKFTIKEIFRLTPDPETIIKGCQYRYHDYYLTNFNSTDCYNLFKVGKYLIGPYVCFTFTTRERNNHFDCEDIPKSPSSPYEMYSITLVDQFLSINVAKFISFIPSIKIPIPTVSYRFARTVNRFGKHGRDKTMINYAFISGDMYAIEKLPQPYDTRCTHTPGEDEYSSKEKCNNDVYKLYKLASPMDIILKGSNLRPFSVRQNENESLIQEIKTKLKNCKKDCHRSLCSDWYSVSQTIYYPFLRLNSISITSTCSIRPTTQIVFIPKITIIDYIVYLSGCFGIWFGVSVISLNPFSTKKLAKSNALSKGFVPFQAQRDRIKSRSCRKMK